MDEKEKQIIDEYDRYDDTHMDDYTNRGGINILTSKKVIVPIIFLCLGISAIGIGKKFIKVNNQNQASIEAQQRKYQQSSTPSTTNTNTKTQNNDAEEKQRQKEEEAREKQFAKDMEDAKKNFKPFEETITPPNQEYMHTPQHIEKERTQQTPPPKYETPSVPQTPTEKAEPITYTFKGKATSAEGGEFCYIDNGTSVIRYSVGDEIDGFSIVRITSNSAILENSDGEKKIIH